MDYNIGLIFNVKTILTASYRPSSKQSTLTQFSKSSYSLIPAYKISDYPKNVSWLNMHIET